MRLLLIILFLALFSPIQTVSLKVVPIPISEAVNPFESIIRAIVTVESGNDNLAHNISEDSRGAFQIRKIRIDDFNNRTGKSYTHDQCFDYEISKQIFLYYASQIGPGNIDKIIMRWNGKGKMAEEYLKKVKKHLDILQ